MIERKLELVKTERSSPPAPSSRIDEPEQPDSRFAPHTLHIVELEPEPEPELKTEIEADAQPEVKPEIEQVTLSQAEVVEAARFREIVAARAARQAMLHRIMAELQELDEISTAA